jgi:hypothetical protein
VEINKGAWRTTARVERKRSFWKVLKAKPELQNQVEVGGRGGHSRGVKQHGMLRGKQEF